MRSSALSEFLPHSRIAEERQQSRHLCNPGRLLRLVELFNRALTVVDRACERVQLHDEDEVRAGDVDLGELRVAQEHDDVAVVYRIALSAGGRKVERTAWQTHLMVKWPRATAKTIHCIAPPHFCLTPTLTRTHVAMQLASKCR